MTQLSEAILNDTKGISFTLNDPVLVRLVRQKADFIVLDTTVKCFAPEALAYFIAAAGDTPVFVRVADTQSAILQTYLNAGIDGLILTGLHYATEVEKAIAACLYPPEGIRPFTAALKQQVSLQAMNDQLTLIVEIAHPQTAAQIEEIAEVTGINGILIAPQKLAIAMERDFNTDHPDVQQTIRTIIATCENFELAWGWEGEAPQGKTPSFHLICSDREIFQQGLNKILPDMIEQDNEPEEEGLRAVR